MQEKTSFCCVTSNFFHLNAIHLKIAAGLIVKAYENMNAIALDMLDAIARKD